MAPRRALASLAALAASIASPRPAPAQEPARIAFERYTLAQRPERHSRPRPHAQVVAVDVWYNVGSRNETRGRTGFAHLFEHMMFQGSANVKKAEHFQLVERAGGEMNGSTAEDRTNYYEALPSNRLNLGLWLEADRMRSLAITDANFENQREAVKEERRLRVDNQPYTGAIFEGMYALADSADLLPLLRIRSSARWTTSTPRRPPDVKAFFDLYYAPNNATLTVAGDFDPGRGEDAHPAVLRRHPPGTDAAPGHLPGHVRLRRDPSDLARPEGESSRCHAGVPSPRVQQRRLSGARAACQRFLARGRARASTSPSSATRSSPRPRSSSSIPPVRAADRESCSRSVSQTRASTWTR